MDSVSVPRTCVHCCARPNLWSTYSRENQIAIRKNSCTILCFAVLVIMGQGIIHVDGDGLFYVYDV